jgi:hypothetical protein
MKPHSTSPNQQTARPRLPYPSPPASGLHGLDGTHRGLVGALGTTDGTALPQGSDPTHPMHVGLHHHRVQRDIDPPPRAQQRLQERPRAGLGNRHRQTPRRGRHHLPTGAVTPGDARIRPLPRASLDPRSRLHIISPPSALRSTSPSSSKADWFRIIAQTRSMSCLVATHRASRGDPLSSATDTATTITNPSNTTPRGVIVAGNRRATRPFPVSEGINDQQICPELSFEVPSMT